ncbi:eIF2 kinase Gcn2p negative regulator [Trapelia coarctata]|nr:eIF2 kinase Gcn2p negative regulator [Trapelia coarctata]
MSELEGEIIAVKAIYGEDILKSADQHSLFILSIPSHPVTLRLRFPSGYPNVRPDVEGTESTGPDTPKGYGSHVLDMARRTLDRVWTAGEVCLYDLMQELESSLANASNDHGHPGFSDKRIQVPATQDVEQPSSPTTSSPTTFHFPTPRWTISGTTIVKKSIFVARACSVSSPAQAAAYISILLATDKKLAKATHNISAYRIRNQSSETPGHNRELVYQDCDDDGETAAGGRLLHLLQVTDVWGVLVVVSRWFGGVKLGPDRFRVISEVAREALVEGGWIEKKGYKPEKISGHKEQSPASQGLQRLLSLRGGRKHESLTR